MCVDHIHELQAETGGTPIRRLIAPPGDSGGAQGAAGTCLLKQFQEKCEAVFRPELRRDKRLSGSAVR